MSLTGTTLMTAMKTAPAMWPMTSFLHCGSEIRLAMCLLLLSTTSVLNGQPSPLASKSPSPKAAAIPTAAGSSSSSSPIKTKSIRNASPSPSTSPSPPMPNNPSPPQQPRKIIRTRTSQNSSSSNSSSSSIDIIVSTNPPPGSPSPPAVIDGVLLVNGSSPDSGRLLLNLTKYIVAAAMELTAWESLCDDGNFNATLAEYFCGLMGYRYGQQYYQDGISTYNDSTLTYSPFSKITCKRELDTTDDTWRRTYWYTRFPSSARLQCQTVKYPSNCPSSKLVALQCSHHLLPPPAPSSTPIQASPPQSNPPDVSRTIQLLSTQESGQRVELSVNALSGETVWAPLCVSPAELEYYNAHDAPSRDSFGIAEIVCKQASNFVQQVSVVSTFYSQGAPLAISDTVFGRPPTYWVTIIGGINAGARSIQQMTLQVSNTPCSSGHVFIALCREIHF